LETRDRVGRLIAERSSAALGLLKDLVNIDSGTHTPEGVNEVADILQVSFAAAGFDVLRHSQDKYGDHLVATVRGRNDKGTKLLLVGHMDTVFDKGTAAARPYTVDGNIARGPGVHDMKSGLVSCLEATRALLDAGFSDFRQITLLFNSDEEVGSPSSRALIEDAAHGSDVAFVLECAYPDATVVTARKGVGRYLLRVTGKAAHAGADPELGVSAVEEIARKILEIHALTDYASGRTLNVGVLSGGTRRNVVAAEATAEIDLRQVDTAPRQADETAPWLEH
jgi:glutamate carboxypeptidase